MPYRFRVLGLLFLLVFIMYLDRLCIAVAGPRIQQDLGLSPKEWGWVIGAFTLGYALFEMPSGAMGDRIGQRKVLSRIVIWWSAFTALTGTVTSFGPLLLIRFLFGAGEAGAFPNCAGVVSRWIPAQERARSTSIFWIASSLGGVVTPLIVVNIQQAYSWRESFYLFGSVGIIWAVIWYRWFRDHPQQKHRITTKELDHIGTSHHQIHGKVPWKVMFRNPNFQKILLMYHLYCWGAYFYLSWLHTYLQLGRGMTEDQMKFASTLPPAAGAIGVILGGYLSDMLLKRYNIRIARCSVGSASLFLSGVLMLAATATESNSMAVFYLSIGMGVMNAMLPVAWSICVDIGGQHAGAVSGAMNMSGQFGSFISSVAFGYFVEMSGSYDTALIPLAAMLLVSGFVFLKIDPAQVLDLSINSQQAKDQSA